MNSTIFTFSSKSGLVCRMEVDNRKLKFMGEYDEARDSFLFFSTKELEENQTKHMNFFGSE